MLNYCRHNSKAAQLLKQLLSLDISSVPFHLSFTNREVEKLSIHKYLQQGFYVQIHAPGGLGKTYLLREIQRELGEQGWHAVWIDFACDVHRICVADRFAFMRVFAQGVWSKATPDLRGLDEPTALQRLGRELANLERVVLLLDNADCMDTRLRTWLRGTFLEQMALETELLVLASAKEVVEEWQGHRTGRSFYPVLLSEFNDPRVIREVVDDVARRYAVPKIQHRISQESDEWQQDLGTIVPDLMVLARGHPLALEYLLKYFVEDSGLLESNFFATHHADLIERCLVPVVDGRILSHVSTSIREAFRCLCIFRYVWPGLLDDLCEDAALWSCFAVARRPSAHLWMDLQGTQLIDSIASRHFYPISSSVRQLVKLVLLNEDPILYQERNRFARRLYERLLLTPSVTPVQRVACMLEIFYHTTQEDDVSSEGKVEQMESAWQALFGDCIDDTVRVQITQQLNSWLSGDAELCEAMDAVFGSGMHAQWLARVRAML